MTSPAPSPDMYDPNKGYPGFVQHNVKTFEKSESRSPILYKYMSRIEFPTTCFSPKPHSNDKSPTPQMLTYAGLYKSDSDKSDSPLKTIIRTVYHQQQQQQEQQHQQYRSHSPTPELQTDAASTPLFNFPLMENFPVVETALYDLQNISLNLKDVLENKSIGAITIIPIVDDDDDGDGDDGCRRKTTTATTIFPVNDVDDSIDFGGVKDIIYTTIHEMPSTLSSMSSVCVARRNRITEIHENEKDANREGSHHVGREFPTEVLWYWLGCRYCVVVSFTLANCIEYSSYDIWYE